MTRDEWAPMTEPAGSVGSALSAGGRAPGGRWPDGVLGAALVVMALVAGLNFTFAAAVMPNLAGADDHTFVATMQRFNENPSFPLSFTAALVL
ncbi:MAG TPA: hypothetical protein VK507_06390, partial [Iamia sp.]|nr:hypothetical protein [Iamia sp.]